MSETSLADLIAPFDGDVSSGSDPVYDDVFLQLKEEVNRLSGIDDARVVRMAAHVLMRTGKDLRVAGYFAFGKVRQSGGVGLVDGLGLMAALIDRFGDDLYPRRAEARKAAVEWLSSRRVIDALADGPAMSASDIASAVAALGTLTRATSAWPEPCRPGLAALATWLAAARSALDAQSPSHLPRQASVSPTNAAVTSLRDLLDQARGLAAYLRDQEGGMLAATRLLLGVRWNPLAEPPPADEQGRTRLAAPRGEVLRQVERLAAQSRWHDLAAFVDGAFMEGANHLWLDLARYRDLAVVGAYPDDLALRDALRADLRLLLERLPELGRLAFDDGTPYMDDATRGWVEAEIEAPRSAVEAASVADGDRRRDIDEEAFARLAAEGLPAAIVWLRTASDHGDARERFLRRWCLARVLDRAGHGEQARHLLEALDADAERFGLAEWEPALCFDVKQHLLRKLRDGMHRKGIDKAASSAFAERLAGELVRIDPLRALDLA